MIKASDIDTSKVTSEQIGRCHKCFAGSIAFYMVESERDNLVEYKVTWDREHGFRCTCDAGKHGFANCKAGVCKHVIWSMAASREEKAALAEIERELAAEKAAKEAKKREEEARRNFLLTAPVARHMRKAPRERH